MSQELQRRVAAFVEAHGLETDAVHRALDVVSEVGEVAFSIICLANTTGVDLERSVLKALKRYEERIKSTRDAVSG